MVYSCIQIHVPHQFQTQPFGPLACQQQIGTLRALRARQQWLLIKMKTKFAVNINPLNSVNFNIITYFTRDKWSSYQVIKGY